MKHSKLILTAILAFILGTSPALAGGLPMGATMERGAMMQDAAILDGGRAIPLTDADADFAPILVAQVIVDKRQKRTEYKGWSLGGWDENGEWYGAIPRWSATDSESKYRAGPNHQPGWYRVHYAAWEGNWSGVLGLASGANNGTRRHINSPTDTEKYTPLHIVVKYDKLEALKGILSHQFNYHILEKGGMNINAKNKWGNTPLHMAVAHEREEMVKLLVEAGAEINARNNDGQTPLEYAEAKGKNRMVYVLDTLGAEVDDGEAEVVYDLKEIKWRKTKYNERNSSSYGYTDNEEYRRRYRADGRIGARAYWHGFPLYQEGWLDMHHMARDDNFNMLLQIAAWSAPGFINKKTDDKRQQTPLHIAAWHGNTKTVLYMIRESKDAFSLKSKGKLDIDPKERYGKTPLHFAAARGHEQIVKLLVAAGASIDEPDRDKKTPLHQAAQAGESGTVKVLLELGADRALKDNKGNTPAVLAEKHGKHAAARRLREREGESELAVDEGGFTELHKAAKKGDHKEVRSLVQKWGKNINETTANNKDTALHIASWYGKDKVVEYITKARKRIRADIGIKDKNGSTPLHNAAAAGHTKIAKMLIQAGADINAQDNSGNTPLHRAAEKNKTAMAEFLVKNGADINKGNNGGIAPARNALENGSTATLRKLIEVGKLDSFLTDRVDGELRGGKALTLLHDAARHNKKKAAKALLELDADVEAKGPYGWRAVHYAARYNHHHVLKMLIDDGVDIFARTEYGSQGNDELAIDYSDRFHGTESESSKLLRHAAYEKFMENCRKKPANSEWLCNLGYALNGKDNYYR